MDFDLSLGAGSFKVKLKHPPIFPAHNARAVKCQGLILIGLRCLLFLGGPAAAPPDFASFA